MVGNTKTLKMKNTKKKVKWTSGKNGVVKVSQKGVVTARKKGNTTVTAKVSGKKYTCRVTVKDAKLSTYRLSLKAGGSKKLKLTNSKGKVKWSSTDRSVVKVSQTGVVAAVKPGTAAVKAKVAASTYQCKVTVKEDGNSTVPGETGTPTGTPGETGTPTEIPETPAAPPDAEAVTLDFYTAGGGDFICGVSQPEVQFALDADTINVKVQILNALDEVVYEQEIPSCRKGETYKVQWDGKKPDGSYVGDTSCYVKITAGEKESRSEYLTAMSASDFEGGNGSQANPYQVVTLEHLRKVGQHNKCYFIQTVDIDADYQILTAMFRSDNPFEGTYDGNGKRISNLMIQNTSDGKGAAIFYHVGENGVIKDLTLSKCTSSVNLDKINSAYGACLAVTNSGKIQDCVVEECTVIASAFGTYAESTSGYGGMIAMEQKASGLVANCRVINCNISTTGPANYSSSYAGGIMAVNEGRIIGCRVEQLEGSSRSSLQWAGIGGIVCSNNSSGIIVNATVSGGTLKAAGGRTYAGGIAAVNEGQITGWSFIGTLDANKTGDGCPDNKGVITP